MSRLLARTATQFALALAATVAVSGAAFAEGDAAKGQKIFNKCKSCHTIDEGGASRTGPNLFGVVDRTFGAVEGFKYSPAMVEAGAAGRTWTVEELDAFITSPKKALPGTRMSFNGMPKEQERADLMAYLVAQGPAATEAPAADAAVEAPTDAAPADAAAE